MIPESLAALLVPCAECRGEGTIAKGNDGRNTYPSPEPVVTCPACHGARYPALLCHLSEQADRLTSKDDELARVYRERDHTVLEQEQRIKELERERDGLLDCKKDLSFIGEQTGFGDHIIVGVADLRDRLARAESDTKIFTGLLEEFITMWSSLHLGEAYTRWDHRGFEALRNRTRKLIDDAAIAKSRPQERSNADV